MRLNKPFSDTRFQNRTPQNPKTMTSKLTYNKLKILELCVNFFTHLFIKNQQ